MKKREAEGLELSVKQAELTRYGVECPNAECREWHESECGMKGQRIHCICGTKFGVI